MITRKCLNCGEIIDEIEHQKNDVSHGICPLCFYWTVHFNRYRRLYELSPTKHNERLMQICRKKLEQRKGVCDESFNLVDDGTFTVTY